MRIIKSLFLVFGCLFLLSTTGNAAPREQEISAPCGSVDLVRKWLNKNYYGKALSGLSHYESGNLDVDSLGYNSVIEVWARTLKNYDADEVMYSYTFFVVVQTFYNDKGSYSCIIAEGDHMKLNNLGVLLGEQGVQH